LPTSGFTKANSALIGWTINGVDYSLGQSYELTSNATAYAKWKTVITNIDSDVINRNPKTKIKNVTNNHLYDKRKFPVSY